METLSIGAVVRLTGISADTLRTWERRYGFPTPQRNESGHRRYARSEFERLVQVKGLVARGHRPSEVIRMTDQDLAQAVGQSVAPSAQQPAMRTGLNLAQRADELIAAILLKIEKLQAQGIERLLETMFTEMGPHAAIEYVLTPTLVQIGLRWRAGRLGVHHEHLFSARLSAFLTSRWQPLSDRNSGPLVVLATPPGEEHELGLHIAAMLLALSGARILFLGRNTPSEAVTHAVWTSQADAVAFSVSVHYPRSSTVNYLDALLQALSGDRVLIGGAGAEGQGWPCVHMRSNEDIQAWLSNRQTGSGNPQPPRPGFIGGHERMSPGIPTSLGNSHHH